MPPFCEIFFRGPRVGIYLLLPAIRGSATATRRVADKCERFFVYEVQEIRLISPDNFADSYWRE
jgi:hypothetical protein